MDKPRIAVIGIGHLGSIHAKILSGMDNCRLVGVCDVDKARLSEVSKQLGVEGFADYVDLYDKIDAAIIAVPTKLHHKTALGFLEHKINTFVEKPFTSTLEQADSLIRAAEVNKLILQVGHIERFNSAFSATQKLIKEPKFIECHRLSPFPNRSLDVGAVLDIMIHDIDIVLGLVRSKIKKVESVGINVLTPFEDIANTRISFENGCVANLTASRISDETMRKIRIFQENTYISLDYKEARASIYRKNGPVITKEDLPIENEQPLQKEIASFIDCVTSRKEPLVSGPVAREALAVALEIQKQIWQQNK
ncbi:MAG: Gfo/Idh/MocA family oxidoreductase [Candidatus Omnitrophota bacterium]